MYKEKGVKKPYEEFERESYENLEKKYGKWLNGTKTHNTIMEKNIRGYEYE